jgi:hypothetical protein
MPRTALRATQGNPGKARQRAHVGQTGGASYCISSACGYLPPLRRGDHVRRRAAACAQSCRRQRILPKSPDDLHHPAAETEIRLPEPAGRE